MFFKKTERKKHSISAILTIGALAAIGAVSITRCGKNMLDCMTSKMKSLFKKGKEACSSMDCMEDC